MLVTHTFAQFCVTTRHMANCGWLECVRDHNLVHAETIVCNNLRIIFWVHKDKGKNKTPPKKVY